jgi:hypothetical protein
MAGVVPTLISRDDAKSRSQEIDNLPLAFIAPLRAEHRKIHRWHPSEE